MKKILILGTAIILAVQLSACAETVKGKVVKAGDNQVTIQQADGTQTTMKTTDNTTYRKKKKSHHKHKGQSNTTYQPMISESDMVEVIYFPSNDEMIIEEVTVWDD